MNKDGVEAAFELIVEEIEAVECEIAEQGGKSFLDKAYNTAQQLIESGKRLQDFRTRVEALLADWQSGIDVPTRQRFSSSRFQELLREPVQAHKPAVPTRRTNIHRGPRTRLRVVIR